MDRKAGLTPRQLEVLRWIVGYQRRTGFMPTIREIGLAFGMASTNGPRWFLHVLASRGMLKRTPGRARTIRLTEAGQAAAA